MHSSKFISLVFFSYRSLDERTDYKKGMSVVSAIHNSQSGQCAECLKVKQVMDGLNREQHTLGWIMLKKSIVNDASESLHLVQPCDLLFYLQWTFGKILNSKKNLMRNYVAIEHLQACIHHTFDQKREEKNNCNCSFLIGRNFSICCCCLQKSSTNEKSNASLIR